MPSVVSLVVGMPTTPLYLFAYFCAALWLATVAYFMHLFVTRMWMLRKFRGPLAIPFLGNCYSFETLSFMKFLAQLRKTYGKIFTVFPFAKAYLVICDPVVVRRVLSDTRSFTKGADYKEIFALVFGEGLVTSTGEKHTKDRAIFSKYFMKANVNKYVGIINSHAKEALAGKIMTPLVAKGGSMDFNIETFFATLALRVFLQFSMNTTFKDDPKNEEELCHLVSQGSWATARMMSLNLPMWSIFPTTRIITQVKERMWTECDKAIKRRRAELAAGTAEDVDDCLSAIIRENMSEKDVMDHVMTLVCAGHDTTTYLSAFMVLLLAQHSDVQDRVRAEILEKVGDRQEITMEDLGELKFLQQVMQETLRLYAVIPFVARVATEEVTVKEAGIVIPKGADVVVPLYLLNRDPSIWENPSVFDPDRFDEKTSTCTSAQRGFFPFGYGSRTCIGTTLAQTENGIFMCHLLRKVSFAVLPGYKPLIFGGISLTTSNGVHVIVKNL